MSSNVTRLFPEEPDDGLDGLQAIKLGGLRDRCLACGADFGESHVYKRLRVCPRCRYHYSISARRHIAALADPGTFNETNRWLKSLDPIEFTQRVAYRARLVQDQERTGLTEAAVTGTCSIGGVEVVIVVLDFSFLGGSMGMVVGEKITLAIEMGARKKLPVVAVLTSGGARIQEGVMSLQQMAKTVIALESLKRKAVPFIGVLGNPCTGQVLASFASKADVLFAEPGAHIGFAPFRAIQEAEGEDVKPDEYTSERMLEAGHIDRVTDREQLKHEVATVLDLISPDFKLTTSRRSRPPRPAVTPLEPWEMVQIARRPDRPRSRDYIDEIFSNFMELHGDRLQGDDPSVVTGIARIGGESVVVVAQQKQTVPRDEDDEHRHDMRGDITPEGFRKAARAVRLAERFRMPLITFIDTPGPKIGIEYERRGLAAAISSMIDEMARVETPTISVLIGEGGSEAALSFSIADRFLMLQNAIYSPMAPEEAAGELRDSGREQEVAKALRLTSNDCLQMGIIDEVVPEPVGGAHTSPGETARLLKRSLMRELSDLRDVHRRTLARRRQKKYRKMGEYGSRFQLAVRGEVKAWQAAFSAGVKAFRNPDEESASDTEGTGGDTVSEEDGRPEAQNE